MINHSSKLQIVVRVQNEPTHGLIDLSPQLSVKGQPELFLRSPKQLTSSNVATSPVLRNYFTDQKLKVLEAIIPLSSNMKFIYQMAKPKIALLVHPTTLLS